MERRDLLERALGLALVAGDQLDPEGAGLEHHLVAVLHQEPDRALLRLALPRALERASIAEEDGAAGATPSRPCPEPADATRPPPSRAPACSDRPLKITRPTTMLAITAATSARHGRRPSIASAGNVVISASGMTNVNARFSAERMVTETLDVYRDVARRHVGPSG